jgi:hypothetical protein
MEGEVNSVLVAVEVTTDGDGRPSLVPEIVFVVAAWLWLVGMVAAVQVAHPVVRAVALFVHLVSLALGFGAVLVTDAYGVLWLLGRRTAAEVVRLALSTHTLALIGFGGLVVSGAVLAPDLGSVLGKVKLLLVLAITLNALNAHRFLGRLRQVGPDVSGDDIAWSDVTRGAMTAALSQLAWWATIGIGFLTTMSRHR